jgi:hypothetical protein
MRAWAHLRGRWVVWQAMRQGCSLPGGLLLLGERTRARVSPNLREARLPSGTRMHPVRWGRGLYVRGGLWPQLSADTLPSGTVLSDRPGPGAPRAGLGTLWPGMLSPDGCLLPGRHSLLPPPLRATLLPGAARHVRRGLHLRAGTRHPRLGLPTRVVPPVPPLALRASTWPCIGAEPPRAFVNLRHGQPPR